MLDKLDTPQLQEIIRSSPIGMMLLDAQGRVSWLNDTLQDMLGSRAAALLSRTAAELDPELQPLLGLQTTWRLPAAGTEEELWLMGHSHQLDDQTGVQYLIDITPLHWLMEERDQLRSELEDVIMVDKETGIRNRKGLYYSLEPQLSRTRRYNRPLSVIIMRLDCMERFKTHFHQTHAAPLLVSVSHLLNEQLRWADIIGRLNDTDFLLVLPETQAEAANQVVSNLQSRLGQLPIEGLDSKDFAISARFGVAEWRKGDDMSLLLARARSSLKDDASLPASHG
jgi:diguanylate cyclase (GGDEF)-like protein